MISDAGQLSLLLTPDEAASAIGVSKRTLARLTHPHGPLACVRFGSGVDVPRKQYGNRPGPPRLLLRYRVSDIQDWINSQLEGAAVDRSKRGAVL